MQQQPYEARKEPIKKDSSSSAHSEGGLSKGAPLRASVLLRSPRGAQHHAQLGKYTAQLWRNEELTDVVIIVQNQEFRAHKAVLACFSPYLSEVLVKPGFSDVHCLQLPNVTAKAFGILLHYMYTGDLHVGCQDLSEVYRAARKLGVDGALKKCIELFHVTTEKFENMVYLYVTARKLNLQDATLRAFRVMVNHFERLVMTLEYLDLEKEHIVELLSSGELGTRGEIVVFLAALKWINHKFIEREEHTFEVLNCVRFGLMTIDEIIACYHPPLIPGIIEMPRVRGQLLDATCYITAKSLGHENLFGTLAPQPRKYLITGDPMKLWDTSLFEPESNKLIRRIRAVTAIQALVRGFLTRRKLLRDIPKITQKSSELPKGSEEKKVDFKPTMKPQDSKAYTEDPNVPKSMKPNVTAGSPSMSPPMESQTEDTDFPKSFRPYTTLRSPSIAASPEKPDVEVPSSLQPYTTPRSPPISPEKSQKEDTEVSKSLQPYTTLRSHSILSSPEKPDVEVPSSIQPYTTLKSPPRSPSPEKSQTADTEVPKSFQPYTTLRSQSVKHSPEVTEYQKPTSQYSAAPKQQDSINIIHAMGAFDSKRLNDNNTIFKFDVKELSWKIVTKTPAPLHDARMVSNTECLYVIGGSNPTDLAAFSRMQPLKDCYQYHLKSDKWTVLPNMNYARSLHAAVEFNGNFLAIGGKNEVNRILTSIEKFSPSSGQWTPFDQDLPEPRMAMGVTFKDSQLWVAGGFTSFAGAVAIMDNVWCFDVKQAKWSVKTKLPLALAFPTLLSDRDKLICIGGATRVTVAGKSKLESVNHVYRYENDAWVKEMPMTKACHSIVATYTDKNIYVFGGFCTQSMSQITDPFYFDSNLQQWLPLGPLPDEAAGFIAAVTEH